ncbi:MAG: DUF4097 family beta strand repeat-containing protein [Acidobacteriota bacterium]
MPVRRIAALALLLAAPLLAAEKEETITKSYPSHAGKVVLVDAASLDLTVRSTDIPDIRVKVELSAAAFKEAQAKAWIDAHRPTLEDSEDTLKIIAPEASGFGLLKGVVISKARIEIIVPSTVRPDLSVSSGNLQVDGEYPRGTPMRLRAASGDVEFTGWTPDLESRSTSGDITVLATKAIDTLLVRTASGAVHLTGGARSVRCDSSSGDVFLNGLIGPLKIATTSGKVTARFDALQASDAVSITTSSGWVRVTLPPGAQPSGEITSSKGEIRSSYPGQSPAEGGQLNLGGSGPKVVITTTSGKVELM